MCPACWINGLVAFLAGMGLLVVDSPYTPFIICIVVILTLYSFWQLWKGYGKWKNFSNEQRSQNWKAIRRFTYGLVVGAVIASVVWYFVEHETLHGNHHAPMHTHEEIRSVPTMEECAALVKDNFSLFLNNLKPE